MGRPSALRLTARIGKNVLGVILVVMDMVLTLPGVPGQGMLTEDRRPSLSGSVSLPPRRG